MHFESRPITVVLLVAFFAAISSSHGLAFPEMQTPHPAGCHSPAPSVPFPVPSPAPSNYACCVMGHHWAIPGAAFSVDPPAALMVGSIEDSSALNVAFSARPRAVVFASASPPLATPLRI
jgi:hypothetical protein